MDGILMMDKWFFPGSKEADVFDTHAFDVFEAGDGPAISGSNVRMKRLTQPKTSPINFGNGVLLSYSDTVLEQACPRWLSRVRGEEVSYSLSAGHYQFDTIAN